MPVVKSLLREEGRSLSVLGLILLVGLVLRVVHNDHGLPYVYYVDEGSHFTKRAIETFRHADPGYFQNPSGYTYLLYLVYRVIAVPLGGSADVVAAYRANATWVFEVSRALAAVLCLAGVAGVYAVGRSLWDRTTGLVAAAVLCFAFLPVAFSRLALTDVGALLPVALCLLCSVRVAETAKPGWCAWAGAAVGVAVGFKYTAGLVVLVPLTGLALAAGARRAAARRLLAGAAIVVGAAVVAFFVTTPYFFLDVHDAVHQLRGQADVAGSETKLGQSGDSGPLYYLGSLTWGLGWLATAAAAAGVVVLARRDRARPVLLLVFPVALFLYLSVQSRFFGRWLLPVYPMLALLAAVALVRGAEAVRGRRPALAAPALAIACAIVLYQPLAADTRSMAVLGHRDTRDIARRWLASTQPRGLRVVVEPAVPDRWFWPAPNGRPRRSADHPQLVNQLVRDTQEAHVQYTGTLRPSLLDRYRAAGYCTVVTMDLIRGRVEADRRPAALAYYARLERESDRIFTVSPYRADAHAPPFSFDLSYSYYSPAYERPGPEVRIYRLHDCRQRAGRGGGV